MTRGQAEHLIIINEGNFCARISRRPDGGVITLEDPAPKFIARRASPLAAAVVSAAISVASTAPGLAAGPTRQAQVSRVAPGEGNQSSKPETPFKPITLEAADPGVLDVPISIPVVQGLVAIRPSTLRVLYSKSDLVVVGQTESSSPISGAASDQVVTHYQVSSLLKGKSRKQQISVIHYENADERFAEGTTALLFLSKGSAVNGASRGTYVLAEPGAGIKVLPQAAIDAYVARIQDLGKIEQREHSLSDIVEWLVQCAEDSATRWDGACDLADGSIDYQGSADSNPGSILTAEQRGRLVTALLATKTIGRGELKLVELIESWNEPSLVEFLLARLHDMEENPTEFADTLVQHLSDSVGSCEVSALADSFKDLPSAEHVSDQDEGEQNEEEQIGQEQVEVRVKAFRADKAKEAARKRSLALKEFLAAVESRVRPKDPIVH
jgi:hypothetical protein